MKSSYCIINRGKMYSLKSKEDVLFNGLKKKGKIRTGYALKRMITLKCWINKVVKTDILIF